MARGSESRAASELKAPKGAAVEKPSKNITKAMGEMPIIGKNGRIDTTRIIDGLSSLREMMGRNPEEIDDVMADLAGELGQDAAKTAAGIIVDSLEVSYLKQAKELAVKDAIKFGEGDQDRIGAQYDKQIKDAEDAVRSGVAEFLSIDAKDTDGDTPKTWLAMLTDSVSIATETSKNMGEMDGEKEQAARFDMKRVKVMLNDAYTTLTENLGTEARGTSRSASELLPAPPKPNSRYKADGSSLNLNDPGIDSGPRRQNPYDQPGVESGPRRTPGYDEKSTGPLRNRREQGDFRPSARDPYLRDGPSERGRPKKGEMRDGPPEYRRPPGYTPGNI